MQACGFFTEQMPCEVSIDVNMFLGAFSIEVDGQRIRPPSWVSNGNNAITIVPSTPVPCSPPSESSTSLPIPFSMNDYRRCRQEEAIRWINLQEKRASIIPRLKVTMPEDYENQRQAIMSETGPFCRKQKKQSGMLIYLITNMHYIYE